MRGRTLPGVRALLGGLPVRHRVVGPAPTTPLGEVQIGVGELHLGRGGPPTTPVGVHGLLVDARRVLGVTRRPGRPLPRGAFDQLAVDDHGPPRVLVRALVRVHAGVSRTDVGSDSHVTDLGGHHRRALLRHGGHRAHGVALVRHHDRRDLRGDLLRGLLAAVGTLARGRGGAPLLHGAAHGLATAARGLAAQGLL